MPHVIPADAEKFFPTYKIIESKVKLPEAYRSRQCRDKVETIQYVTLNSDRYAAVDYNLSFSNHKFYRVYGDAELFGVKFFGMDELITQFNITPSDYKTLYPLFTFDISKPKEKLKSSVVDIQIKANFTENVRANTRAFALVLSDKMLSLNQAVTKCM